MLNLEFTSIVVIDHSTQAERVSMEYIDVQKRNQFLSRFFFPFFKTIYQCFFSSHFSLFSFSISSFLIILVGRGVEVFVCEDEVHFPV